MANSKTIGAKIQLDGEKEFRSAITSCNKSISAMKSEMNLLVAQTAGNANSLDTLKKKHEILTKTLDEQKKKEEEIERGRANAVQQYDRVGKELDEYKDQLKAAREKLDEMKNSGTATEEELKNQEAVVDSLSRTVENGERTYQIAGDRVQEWEKQLYNAKTQTLETDRALHENAAYMKEAEEAADGCATSIDKFGAKTDEAAKETSKLTETLTGFEKLEIISGYLDKFSGAMKDLAGNAYDAAIEIDEGYQTIITKTGATGEALEDLNKSADRIFSEMPVEMADVGTAIGEVNTRFGQTGEALEETSEKFIRFAKINGTDLNESIDVTDRILKQFNLDVEDAGDFLGLLTARGQETGISVSGLMSSLDANAATLKELNFGIEESANLLAMFEINGVDAGTAINGLKKAVSNYTKEGLSAREGLEQTIESIKKAETSTEALAIAQEVFGTKGAQVMADGIRSGRIDLDSLTDSMSQYGSVVENTYNQTLRPWDEMKVAANNLKAAGSDLAGEFLRVAAPAIKGLTGFVKEATKGFQAMPQPMKTVVSMVVAVGAGAGVAVPKIAKLYGTIKTLKTAGEATKALNTLNDAQKTAAGVAAAATLAEKANTDEIVKNTAVSGANTTATVAESAAKGAEATATGAATVAQEGLNVAMGACPVLALAAGVGILVGAVALFAKGTGEAGDATDELNGKVKEMGETLEESQEKLASSMDAAAEAVDNVQAKAVMASSAADELVNLAEKTSLTNEEQSRMRTLVGELNTLYPEMGLEIDSVTGKLNMGSAEIAAYVDNMKQMALAEAYTRAAADSYDAVVEATTELTKAEEVEKETSDALAKKKNDLINIQKAEEKRLEDLEKAQKDYSSALASGAEDTGEYTRKINELEEQLYEVDGRTMSYSDAVMALNDEIYDLEQTQEEATEKVREQKEAVEEATQTADGYIEKSQEATQAVEEQEQALEKIAEQYEETAQVSITTAGRELEAFESLSAGTQEKAVEVANSVLSMQESITGTLESQMQMFEEFNEGTKITKDQILENMQSQVDGVVAWEQNMNTLMTETKTLADGTTVSIDEGLMQYLASMGPEGSTYMKAFVDMSAEELAQANALWEQSVDIKGMKNEWGEELTQSIGELSAGGTEAWNDLAKEMGMAASESGEYVVQGMVTGMKEAARQLEAAGEEAGESVLKSLDTSLGVASPSKKTKESGGYVIEGLAIGMQQKKDTAVTMAENVAKETVTKISTVLSITAIRPIGYNIPIGLAEGIIQGKSRVIQAAEETASSAIQAVKRKLDIHSPSGVFREIGDYTVEGAVQGAREGIPKLERAYGETAQAAVEAYEGQMKEMVSWMDIAPYSAGYSRNSGSRYGNIGSAGDMEGVQGERNTGAGIAKLLEICLSYLPYLEQMAETYGQIYLDPREASRKMAPYMNKDLISLRR